ncbi:MAG: ABC transporter ATP-binding protein [Bacteroidota bacterium]
MRIKLSGVGKRYRREWILRQIDLDFQEGGRYGITGPNGSGKSTLLKMLSGHLTPTRGKIEFTHQAKAVEIGQVYNHLAYAAPYIELIEEFTLEEAIRFHQRFRPLLPGLTIELLIDRLGLKRARSRPIAQFSSGMKQRVKLALACCTAADYLLLDEPTTNLDEQGISWYQQLLQDFAGDRLLIIASNVADDYQICPTVIDVVGFKQARSTR